MGVSKFDKSAAHKRYETRYAGLTTGKQVRLLLRDIHALRIRAEQGDFAAVDVLADLTTAVTRAGLTARQWEAVENVYLRDMTQEDAGRAMGVSRQSMYEYLERAGFGNQDMTGVMETRPVLTPDRAEKRQNGRRFKDDGEKSFTLTAQDKHGVALGPRIIIGKS